MTDTMTERAEFRQVAPFELTRSQDGEDGLTMEGYASVFDSPTQIQGRSGSFTETVKRGAFAKTIESRTPVLMFDHGKHPLFGQMPIGTIRHLAEDERGLFVRARLSKSWLIEPIREAISDNAITGMSFRMQVMQDGGWSGFGPREITEVRCPELGPVVLPAYLDTEVSVRSREVAEALTDPEVRAELARMFTDTTALGAAAGTSTSEAVTSENGEPQQRGTPRVTNQERRLRALQLRGVITS